MQLTKNNMLLKLQYGQIANYIRELREYVPVTTIIKWSNFSTRNILQVNKIKTNNGFSTP